MNIIDMPCSAVNYGGVRGQKVKYLVVHYTAGRNDTAQNNGHYFANNSVGASAHYFVDENTVVRSVPEERVAELAGLKKSDIDWYEKSVHLYGKGRKHRTSFLNAKAEVSLIRYLDSRNDDSEFLFVSSRRPHGNLRKEGIEKIIRTIASRSACKTDKIITPHVLRHTTATTALQSGMPIEDISKLLGHEKIDTTMIYAKTSLENVRSEHKKHII